MLFEMEKETLEDEFSVVHNKVISHFHVWGNGW